VIETGRNCVLQALKWALVIEDVAKIIEAALLSIPRYTAVAVMLGVCRTDQVEPWLIRCQLTKEISASD
jgi:hypothetical protein